MSSCPKRWSLQRAPCPCRSPRASSLRARSPPPTSCPRTEGEDMALFDFLNRKRPALDGASDEGVSPVASDLTANEAVRSEEHTSELQSLMRISYAVFCLKKKKQHQHEK